jgi:hypothetical protein
MTEPRTDDVTRQLLTPMVEQPEPSTNGDWYVVDLRDLLASGYTHLQFHFDHRFNSPTAAGLIKDGDVQ